MFIRAALKAAGVLFLLSPSLVMAAGADTAPASQPAAVDRGADNHATVQSLRVMFQSLPDSTAKTQVLPLTLHLVELNHRLQPPLLVAEPSSGGTT